jgi:GNAT superfamily N-acetyltransferase
VTSNIPLDVKKSERLIRAAMVEQDVGAIWASFIGNKVRGFLIGALIEWPYLEGKYATDWAFIADSNGRELYRAFEQWAKAHGANAIQMGVSSGLPQADAFYESVGLRNVGGIYLGILGPSAARNNVSDGLTANTEHLCEQSLSG